MSIGEVLAHLRAEFPDVTISKLRFLEAEGLVEPRRTPAGYRKYARSDVARLRFVLAAQRDQYLPLRVIREQLSELDRGDGAAPGDTPAEWGRPRPALREVTGDEPAARVPARLSRAELLARSGLAEPALASLEQYGLVAERAGGYDAEALTVARLVAQLAEYGLEPRHLRPYRAAADREVGLFTQVVTPLARQSTPAARSRAAETVRELAALCQQLQAALVRVGLRETLGD
ncbi:MAG TPA: MerR family transcriptional regulator [Rugosimonospora sp.]|nr:MerR family transcriptional regulator [Rugosimonospora sp.]